jgi:quercetin dioxygenase-like cupin family protein
MSTTSPTPSVTRTVLCRMPIPALPGWESRTVLLEYPAGAKSPAHTHPQAGVNYIVQGSILSQWENGEIEHYKTGEIFLDHAEKLHSLVQNPSETEDCKVVVTYVLPVDEPNVKFGSS